MRITDVEPGFVFEGENPQFAQLQHLLTTAKEPWERNQIKWRIKKLRDAESLAGEPGGGSGAPRDARGNYIPVLATKEWMARNPSIVKTLPNDCLPPGMQQPGMLDKIGTTFKNIRNNIVDYATRETELEQQIRQNREDEEAERWAAQRRDPFYNMAADYDDEPLTAPARPRRLKENEELDRIKALTSQVLKG